MPTLSPRDRLSLCRFIFSDGRACRSPRTAADPQFCFYHAQKEAQSQAVAQLAADLTRIFSGGYVSAGDLSAALSRLIPAVLLGHIKPRAARTIAYMLQTFVQTVRLSQHEAIQAFGAKTWRKAVVQSLRANRADRDDDVPPPPPDRKTNSAPRHAANGNGHAKTRSNTVVGDLQTRSNSVLVGLDPQANAVAPDFQTLANSVVASLQTRASSSKNNLPKTNRPPQSPAPQAS